MADSVLALIPCRSGAVLETLVIDDQGEGFRRRTYPLTAHGLPCASHGDRVYVSSTDPSGAGEVSTIDVFRLNRATGDLTPFQTAKMPARMAHVALHPSGRLFFGASFAANLLVVYPVTEDGSLGEEPLWIGETGRRPHMARLSRDARFLYVPCMGSDRVLCYAIDARGRLIRCAAMDSAQPDGSGPRHLAWHPSLPVGYLVCELNGDVVVFARDPQSGRLDETERMSALGASVTGAPWAAEIGVSPDGRHLYCTERRGSTLAWWPLDAEGHPGNRSIIACPLHPRGFDITPCGRVLVLAAQGADRICLYRIESGTGRPVPVAELACAAQPSFVEIRSMGTPVRSSVQTPT